MSELRQNIATKEWVIIATERHRRPEDFRVRTCEISSAGAKTCPFCPGHESMTPPEVMAYRPEGSAPDSPGWSVRVVPNQFAALNPGNDTKRRKLGDFYTNMPGIGRHEVIIEHPEHTETMATMSLKQVEDIFFIYRERYLALAADPVIETIIIFKNHGCNAGTSLVHPHSQLVATPVTPNHIRQRIETAMQHFDATGTCVYCDIIATERRLKERLVLETENYVVIEPYASRSPFETWVLPKKHASSFDAACREECLELAGVVQRTLLKIGNALNSPDYNYAIFTAPCHERELEYFHWYLKIVPRVSQLAGFEIGSGIYINTAIPEEAARFLRESPDRLSGEKK